MLKLRRSCVLRRTYATRRRAPPVPDDRAADACVSRCQTAPGRSPDERSEIRGASAGGMVPACRGACHRAALRADPLAHAGYELVFLIFMFPLPVRFLLFFHFPAPTRGGRSADRRPDAASASGCVHDRTRALTFEARARRRSDPTPRLSALHCDVFWTRPSILLSFFPGPGSNGCSWGRATRGAGRCPPTCGRKPRRGRHTLLGLSGSPLEKTPLREQGWDDV